MLRIILYDKKYRDDFIRLNTDWIRKYFWLEESDKRIFDDVEGSIIDRGGQIFVALDENEKVVGCCALIHHPEIDSYELAKMAVDEKVRGKHIGFSLGKALVSYALLHGIKRIYLEGNTRLISSIHLYRKLGFLEIPMSGIAYKRCDILMELILPTIRFIKKKDQVAMAELIRQVFVEYSVPQVNTVYDDPQTYHIAEIMVHKKAGYWVIDRDGMIGGGCGFYPTEGLPEGYAELVKFYLSPEMRGAGIGSNLFKYIIDKARQAGYKHLYIESFPEFKSAISMYERNGFRYLSHRLGQSGHTATTIHMIFDL